jgi:hypothetical protein
MKITQDTQTYLECKKSALVGYIVAGLLMVGGVSSSDPHVNEKCLKLVAWFDCLGNWYRDITFK